MQQIWVAGEALFDLIQDPDGRLRPCAGGSPFNVALALARLGLPVRYLNPLSTDRFGAQFVALLQEAKVEVSGSRVLAPTSLAVVQVDANGVPAYGFYREGVADRALDPGSIDFSEVQPQLFHVGSLALLPPDGAAWTSALARALAAGVCTSVDANMRPALARDPQQYAQQAREALTQASIVKVSDEDLEVMGLHGDPHEQALALLDAKATQCVILTRGAQGAWAYTANTHLHVPAPRVSLVDTVGAGDCFYAGLLARLAQLDALQVGSVPTTDALQAALEFGSRVTAHNLQRAGCQPPWARELT